MDAPRIVSLLPAATEIVCALGLQDALVGVSHECDHPASVRGVRRLTSTRLDSADKGARAVDLEVRELVARALSIYALDVEGLRDARPDVIVTQDLCRVCAVAYDDVCAAVAEIGLPSARIVSLDPMRLDDVMGDVVRVGGACGVTERAHALVVELRARLDAIAVRARALGSRPRVLTIEWLDPVMLGATWMPELVELAGGEALGVRAGEHAPTVTLDDLARFDVEVVVLKPCGYSLERTLRDRADIEHVVAALRGAPRIFVADGNAFFNRPGPRLVESTEILAACMHPSGFADLAAKHASSFVEWKDAR